MRKWSNFNHRPYFSHKSKVPNAKPLDIPEGIPGSKTLALFQILELQTELFK